MSSSWLFKTRVDLHTPKMLIIQFHISSFMENDCHTTIVNFRKMDEKRYIQNLPLLDSYKTVWWSKIEVFVFWKKKNTYHLIPIYGNCMTSFFDGDTKIFPNNFETNLKGNWFYIWKLCDKYFCSTREQTEGIQCWFKLSGQNEQNLNFKRVFSNWVKIRQKVA